MPPKFYILAVNRRLWLPPWYRLPELNFIARQFYAGRADGQSWEEIEAQLGTPDEAAARISASYPRYEKLPLRFLPMVFGLMSVRGIVNQIARLVKIQIIRNSEIFDSIVNGEEVLQQSLNASILTPQESLVLLLIGLAINIWLYFFFKYSRKYSES